MNPLRFAFVLALFCFFESDPAHCQTLGKQPIDIAKAKTNFAEAEALFSKDNSAMWGISLDGPMIFVDRESRFAVANRADASKALKEVDDVFTGHLPANVMIANTAIDWNETKWTMLLWPLPEDPDERKVLLAHEAWHRIQDKVGFPSSVATNDHLDSLHGRYLLQLEWRALSKALRSAKADAKTERDSSIADALHFRFRRNELLKNSLEQEVSMEMHEGLAEITGVKLALAPADRIDRTVRLLESRPAEFPTFVRSFAYLSGPAYALLLDKLDPDWMENLTVESDLGRLLLAATNVELENNLELAVAERSKLYDGPTLWIAEKKRDDERIAKLELLSKKFLTGPRLIIPLENPRMSFDPRELVPLKDAGTVYYTLTITDEWGVLTVTGGALLSKDFSQVTVGVPENFAGERQTSEWELDLYEGWSVQTSGQLTFSIVKDKK